MRRRRGDGNRSTRLAVQAEHTRARVPATAPLLPHEHDESPETSPLADPVTTQAHADIAKGLVDTERRGDATHVYNRLRSAAAKTPRRR